MLLWKVCRYSVTGGMGEWVLVNALSANDALARILNLVGTDDTVDSATTDFRGIGVRYDMHSGKSFIVCPI